MADLETDLENLDELLVDLEGTMGTTQAATMAFQNELNGMKFAVSSAGAEARSLSRNLSTGLRSALGDLVIDGARLSDVLGNLANSMANAAFSRAITPVTDAVGGAIGGGFTSLLSGLLQFSQGGVFSSGRVSAFARGGIVDGPTQFPMRGGVGLMGEAGPEAIMPLARGADGKLGVRTQGSQVVNVTMNISTPDATSFQKSRTQIAASVTRAMQRGQRNI